MDATANSGSPADIQAAVNAVVAAGGGNVHVPAGDWTFRPAVNGAVVINVPTNGINIIGAGKGITILRADIPPPDESTVFIHFLINGNGRKFRVSGISFLGNVNDDNAQNIGVQETNGLDWRIDNCFFNDFTNQAVNTAYSPGRGLIDHCDLDNTYKDNPAVKHSGFYFVWGYGIGVVDGNNPADWPANVSSILGKYDTLTNVVYIEDCTFTRCRHSIAGNQNGFYVVRHCHFQKSAPYANCDMHGGTPGTRAQEVYANTFDLSDESYSGGQDGVTGPRGGGGVCWGNSVILNSSSPTPTVKLESDGEAPPYDVEQYYIWGNSAIYQDGTPVDFNSKIKNSAGYVQDKNYFLRAPNQAQDGFTYTPYVYPHPLVTGGGPPVGHVTPDTETLPAGTYKITMPAQVQSGNVLYNFKQWEDGSVSPVRIVTLNQNLSLIATYELASVTLTAAAGANGSVAPSGPQTLTVGSPYRFAAVADTGYLFGHWDLNGANLGSSNPITITATAAMDGQTLTALFTAVPPVQISLNVATKGNGTTNPAPGAHTLNVGDVVQFTAIAAAGQTFMQWTLDGKVETSNPAQLTITQAMQGMTLTAEFTSPPAAGPDPATIGGILLGLADAGLMAWALATRIGLV